MGELVHLYKDSWIESIETLLKQAKDKNLSHALLVYKTKKGDTSFRVYNYEDLDVVTGMVERVKNFLINESERDLPWYVTSDEDK